MVRILFLLGGNNTITNFFDIKSYSGDSNVLINLLRDEQKKGNNIELLLDVQKSELFPDSEEKGFWDIFNVHIKNRLIIILHKFDKKISEIISEKKTSTMISGPLYFGEKLFDKTPLLPIEFDLILYALYLIPDYKDLEGALSLRIFLPDSKEDIANKLNGLYQKQISSDEFNNYADVGKISSETDFTSYTIKSIRYNPFNIDIRHSDKLDLSKDLTERIVNEHFSFNEQERRDIFKGIYHIREEKLKQVMRGFHPQLAFRGASKILRELLDKVDPLRAKINDLTRGIKREINIIDIVKNEATQKITELLNQSTSSINTELHDYHTNYKNLIDFVKSHYKYPVLSLLVLGIVFALLYFLLEIDFITSSSISFVFSLIILILIWLKSKRRRINEIEFLCQEKTSKLIKEMNNLYRKVPQRIWDRNLCLLNLKIFHIYENYLNRSIGALKILTEKSMGNIRESIFSPREKLIFSAPARDQLDDFEFDELQIDMSLEEVDLINYFVAQYFKMAKSLRLLTMDEVVCEKINDMCNDPKKGLIFDEDKVKNFRKPYTGKFLFVPEDYNIPESSRLNVDQTIRYQITSVSIQILFFLTCFEIS